MRQLCASQTTVQFWQARQTSAKHTVKHSPVHVVKLFRIITETWKLSSIGKYFWMSMMTVHSYYWGTQKKFDVKIFLSPIFFWSLKISPSPKNSTKSSHSILIDWTHWQGFSNVNIKNWHDKTHLIAQFEYRAHIFMLSYQNALAPKSYPRWMAYFAHLKGKLWCSSF